MENVELPREFLKSEYECDKHNIQQAINMLQEKQSKVSTKRIMKYCKDTTRDVKRAGNYR